MNPVIELDKLSVQFGTRTILKNLNASLAGRAIGLLGPNGAGKTTLIHTLLGFHVPVQGTARVFGMDIRRNAKPIRGLIGYMPEIDSFIARMTAVQFLRLMAELSGLPPRENDPSCAVPCSTSTAGAGPPPSGDAGRLFFPALSTM